MVVGRLLSYWEGNFSRAMLNFGGESVFFVFHHDLVFGVSDRKGVLKESFRYGAEEKSFQECYKSMILHEILRYP